MNKLDVAGILQTYALKVQNARDTAHLREIVCDLKSTLDVRKIKMEDARDV